MANLGGSASADIDAPLQHVWQIVAGRRRPRREWQGGLDRLTALERDGERPPDARRDRERHQGEARSRRTCASATTARTRLSWTQEKGDMKSVARRVGARGSGRRAHARRRTRSTPIPAACSGSSSAAPSRLPRARSSSTGVPASSSGAPRAGERRAPPRDAAVRAAGVRAAGARDRRSAPALLRRARRDGADRDGGRRPTHPGAAVPQDFLGLSFEMSALAADRALLRPRRPRGDAALARARASCASAACRRDTRIAWTDTRTPRPAWATNVVDADDLHALAGAGLGERLAHRADRRHRALRTAGRRARGGRGEGRARRMARRAIEIGNEPNSYAQHAHARRTVGLCAVRRTSRPRIAARSKRPRRASRCTAPTCPGSSAFEAWGPGEAVDRAAGAADRPPLPARLRTEAAAVDHAPAQPARFAPRRSARCAATSRISRAGGPAVSPGRDQLGVLRRRRRHQQHVRLRAVGHRLLGAGHGVGRRRREHARQPDQLQGLLAGLRARSVGAVDRRS